MSLTEMLETSTMQRVKQLMRLYADCEYYIGLGERNANILINNDINTHIYYMEMLLNSFDPDEMPEITLTEIRELEREMKN